MQPPDLQPVIAYIQAQPDWQHRHANIRQQLQQVGWPAHLVDEAFRQIAPQAVDTPAQAHPAAHHQSQSAHVKKPKPPIAAQIFFAFTCVAMLLALLDVGLTFYAAFKPSGIYALFGLGHSRVGSILEGLYKVAYYSAFFWLVLQMRARKMWALIAVSALVFGGLSNLILIWLSSSFIARFFYGSSLIINFIFFGGAAALLGVIWAKNRNSFK